MSYIPPPFPIGLGPNKSYPSARGLQQVLKRGGFMSASVVESDNYGPQTQAAVGRFYHDPARVAIQQIDWVRLFVYGLPEPPMDMTRMLYSHRTVNMRTAYLLDRAGVFTLAQGSYNKGVSASAGTHDGGGVVDISVGGMSYTVRKALVGTLRTFGFAAWLRTPDEGFSFHIHACAIGDREMAPAAQDQVRAYFAGRNGLADNGLDDGPRGLWPHWAEKYR